MADIDWTTLLPYLMMAGGGAAQAYYGAQTTEADRQLQLILAMIRDMSERDKMAMIDTLSRQQQGAELATREPSMQEWRQKQAVTANILPGLRNYEVTPPGDLARFTPKTSGGFRIPEEGFSPETLKFFSPEARLAAEESYYKGAAPFMQPPNLGQAGYGSLGADPYSRTTALYQQGQTDLKARQDAQRQAVASAFDQGMGVAGGKGTPWWQKLLGILGGPGASMGEAYLKSRGQPAAQRVPSLDTSARTRQRTLDAFGRATTTPPRVGGGGGSTEPPRYDPGDEFNDQWWRNDPTWWQDSESGWWTNGDEWIDPTTGQFSPPPGRKRRG